MVWVKTVLDAESENWETESLPLLKKEAETWERILSEFWKMDTGKPSEARAREVVKRTISHLKVHISEFEAEGKEKP